VYSSIMKRVGSSRWQTSSWTKNKHWLKRLLKALSRRS